MPGTVLSAVDLTVNKAGGVPAFPELTSLEGKADKQENEVNENISKCDNVSEKDLGGRRLV